MTPDGAAVSAPNKMGPKGRGTLPPSVEWESASRGRDIPRPALTSCYRKKVTGIVALSARASSFGNLLHGDEAWLGLRAPRATGAGLGARAG